MHHSTDSLRRRTYSVHTHAVHVPLLIPPLAHALPRHRRLPSLHCCLLFASRLAQSPQVRLLLIVHVQFFFISASPIFPHHLCPFELLRDVVTVMRTRMLRFTILEFHVARQDHFAFLVSTRTVSSSPRNPLCRPAAHFRMSALRRALLLLFSACLWI